jgi:diacylglycerol O-acyltransferase
MAPMPPTDAMFLLAESRERPMHVGGLQLFRPPEGSDPDFLPKLYRDAIQVDEVAPLFRRRPRRTLRDLGQWSWADDDEFDIEYHVRHSALPRPGRIRELLELTGRLHGSLLDRNRPMWQGHLIEGLDDGRFAVYMKVHHSLVDGVSALRLLRHALSSDPNIVDTPAPWATPLPKSKRAADGASPSPVQTVTRAIGEIAGVGPAVFRTVQQALQDNQAMLPFQAPRTILNVNITSARRFAAQSWDIERLQAVGKASGATLNDVLLAMCSGALRAYLLDLGALPDQPLVAMVPVSLRKDDSVGGNAVGSILCSLGTDLADPWARLNAVQASMRQGKAALAGMSPLQVMAFSAIEMAPLALAPLIRAPKFMRPAFNLVISNVPGPKEKLYWNGALLEGIYPLSIPFDGQALNITVTSYVDHLEFGLTGCRRSAPHLQRLLSHLETALADLERITGVEGKRKRPRRKAG